MLSSDDLHFFVALLRAPSFAAAARQLSVTPPAVTQRLRSLEARLGVRLFHRSSRGVSLTDEGALLAERSTDVLAEIDSIADLVSKRSSRVSGHLRVAASTGFGRRYVAPLLEAYRHQCPDVRVTLQLSDNPPRLRPDAWDIIVHVGTAPLLDLKRILLAPNRRILCCSPEYLATHEMPEHPADLTRHHCLALYENDEDVTLWRFQGPDGARATVRIASPFSCNDGETIKRWGLAGLGVIVRSEWDVAKDIGAGRLVELLPDWRPPDAPVIALSASRTGRAARTERFIDLLRQSLTPSPWRVAA